MKNVDRALTMQRLQETLQEKLRKGKITPEVALAEANKNGLTAYARSVEGYIRQLKWRKRRAHREIGEALINDEISLVEAIQAAEAAGLAEYATALRQEQSGMIMPISGLTREELLRRASVAQDHATAG